MPTSSRFSRHALVAGVLALAAIAFALLLRYRIPLSFSFLEKTELRLLDARFGIRGPMPLPRLQQISKRVTIVAMDDSATHALGRVIPRASHAELVAQLKKDGAKAIIFDVIFADPSRFNNGELDPQSDAGFTRSVQSAGNVYLPFDHESAESTPPAILKEVETRLAYPLSPHALAEAVHIRPPIAPLLKTMRGGGHIASKPDSDGTFRSAIPLMEVGKIYPHVILNAIGQSMWNLDPQKTPPVLQGEYLVWGDHKIGPLTPRVMKRSFYDREKEKAQSQRSGTAWTIPLNFLGGRDAMQVLTVPYLEVLKGRAANRIKDRVVIIGETATGTPDLRRSPFDSPFDRQDLFFGVETNATFIANLLDNNFLKYAPLWWAALASGAMGLLAGTAAFGLRPGLSLLVASGVLVFYALACILVFVNEDLVLEMTAPFLAVALSYTALTALRLFVTDREARETALALRETQTLLGQYVNESLAMQLSADPEMRRDLQIGARREVTVLFSDIRAFTSWSEKQTPEEVKARLDEYFPVMCEIVSDDYDGYVDKFVGDGLMAVWNGMSDQSDHAHRAVRAALSMKRALAVLNEGWRKQKQEEFNIGIGIASGSAVFGTFGSPRHKLMPTVLGDTVNTASRLEALTKEIGGVIIVSQETYEIVKGEFEFRPLGSVPVRGKTEAQPVYEVLAAKK